MKIAIVGCGIGGLTAGCLASDAGHSISLFEAFETPRPVGSGLVLQPICHQVFAELGILDQIINTGAPNYYMEGTDVVSKRKVLNVTYGPINGPTFGLGIHRASLFDVLYTAAQERNFTFHFGKAIQSSSMNGDQRCLVLEDGTVTEPFDLVIDAAGSNSPISPLEGKDLAYGAVWSTVDWPQDTHLNYHSLQQTYRRASNMIGILPIGTMPNDPTPKAAFFWSLPIADYDKWRATPFADWQKEAIDLWPALEPFILQLKSHDDLTLASYTHGTLRQTTGPAIVHIGDAAHRASPQLGQGANMALLDALALVRALNAYPIPAALKAYSHARRRHVNIYQMMSWAFTPMYQSSSRVLPFLRDTILAPLSAVPPVPYILTKLVTGQFANPLRGLARKKSGE